MTPRVGRCAVCSVVAVTWDVPGYGACCVSCRPWSTKSAGRLWERCARGHAMALTRVRTRGLQSRCGLCAVDRSRRRLGEAGRA